MLRRALRSARGAIADYWLEILATASVASLVAGLAMIWLPLAFVAFGAGGLVVVVKVAQPEPASKATDAAA